MRKFVYVSEMLIVRHLGTPNSGFNGCHCMRDPVLYRSMNNTNNNKKFNKNNFNKKFIISTDEDPSSQIESSAIINLRGVSTFHIHHANVQELKTLLNGALNVSHLPRS